MRGTLLTVKRARVPYVVRHAVTGAVRHTGTLDACDKWCDEHPREHYLVVERRDECHPLDVYDARGMLRNVPGRKKRKPVNQQIGMDTLI